MRVVTFNSMGAAFLAQAVAYTLTSSDKKLRKFLEGYQSVFQGEELDTYVPQFRLVMERTFETLLALLQAELLDEETPAGVEAMDA